MKKQKNYNELTFTDDFMFCKVLMNHPDICEELVSLILDRTIKIAEVQKQAPIEITADGRGIRLDVYAEDDDSVVYDIEMQTTSERNLPKRTRYYQGMIDLNLLERGDDFDDLKEDYIIFICPFDPIGIGLYKYTFKTICVEDKNVILDDATTKIFVNGAGAADKASPKMQALLNYIMNQGATDDFTRRIESIVQNAIKHDDWEGGVYDIT